MATPRIWNGRERNVEPPPGLQRLLKKIGGTNPFGEPLYRLSWGYDRTEFIAGRWFDGFIGYREMPKYKPPARFHLEFWYPASHYGSRDKWRQDTGSWIDGVCYESLGGYPSRGEWEHLWTCETPSGGYLNPTIDLLVYAVQVHKRSMVISQAQKNTHWYEVERAEARTKAGRDADLLGGAGDEFFNRAMKGRTVQELKGELAALAPAGRPTPPLEDVRDSLLRRANGL